MFIGFWEGRSVANWHWCFILESGLMVGDGVTKPTITGNVAESEEQGLRQAVHMVHPGV
jgi:hypothetical protein